MLQGGVLCNSKSLCDVVEAHLPKTIVFPSILLIDTPPPPPSLPSYVDDILDHFARPTNHLTEALVLGGASVYNRHNNAHTTHSMPYAR